MDITLEIRPDEGPSTTPTQRHRPRHRRRHRIIAKTTALGSPLSSEATSRTPPCHTALKYMVPALLGLVGVKYQGKSYSIFEDNPVPTWCFLVATSVYCLVVACMKQIPASLDRKSFHMLNWAALAFGVLSAMSLLSIFLPHQISFVPLIIWIPLPIVLVWPPRRHTCTLIHRAITSVVNWGRGRKLTEEASLPVYTSA